jgi:hypothetical protein
MPVFVRRTLTLAPGTAQPAAALDWAGAIVLVARGAVVLECAGGTARRFAAGSLIWLRGPSVRALRNPGVEDAVLVAVSPGGPPAAPIT